MITCIIFVFSGDIYTVFTEYEYHYDHAWLEPVLLTHTDPHHKQIQFNVKGCNDAHIILSNTLRETSSNVYEIVIGSNANTLSDIRKGRYGEVVVQKSTPNIMNCDQMGLFWVSWDEAGMINVGTGFVHSHTFMQYQSTDPVFYKYASLSTWTSASLEWEVLQDHCKYHNVTFVLNSCICRIAKC